MNIDFIRKELTHCKKNETKLTIPEILNTHKNEETVTRLLANILDPFQNGLDTAPLNNFMTFITGDYLSDAELMAAQFNTGLIPNNKANIIISTKKYIVAVQINTDQEENTVILTNNTVSENSTSPDFKNIWNIINQNKRERNAFGIFLKSDNNKTEASDTNFRTVNFSELLEVLPFVSSDSIEDKNYILYAFRQYIDSVFTKKPSFPVYNDKVRFYHEHLYEMQDILKVFHDTAYMNVISECEKEYDKYFEKAMTWLIKQIAKKGYLNYRFYPGKGGTCWWAFIRSKEWRSLFFHYEILWKASEKLKTGEAELVIHLEPKNDDITDYFTDSSTEIDNDEKSYKLISRSIKLNLTSQIKAEQTIENIIDLINCSEFEALAEKADNYIKNHTVI